MRVRAAAAVAALVAALAVPVHAFPLPERTLTIVGSKTAYATITVTEETYYDSREARATWAGGRWGGFLIGPDSSRPDHKWRDPLTLWTQYDDPMGAGHQSRAVFSAMPRREAPTRRGGHGMLSPGR